MCVAFGDACTSIGFSRRLARPAKGDSPLPSTIGAWLSRISSITPASKPCRTALAPPAIVTVPSPAASRARSIASSKLVTKWKVVPPSISTGSCGKWVSTKTGAWYGGVSPPPLPPIGGVHVATHHVGAARREDPRGHRPVDVVVGLAEVPQVQVLAENAERLFPGLV